MQAPARMARVAWVARALGRLIVFLVCLVGLVPRDALAFTPPAPQGAVTDTSGKLSTADDSALEAHIAAYRARTTNELAVLMVGSLGGESVDDIAYTTFNTWGVGKKGADNGVLLVIAPNERKMRIETGKGVGDRLTDLESSHILREQVGPLLKQDRFREAILAGLTAIETALDRGGPASPAPTTTKSGTAKSGTAKSGTAKPSASIVTMLLPLIVLGFCALVLVGGAFLIVRALRGPRRSGGSSWSSSDSSYSSSSSSDWSSGSSGGSDFGGSSGGGSDFGGSSGGGSDFGGGSSGGGGSSDSY
jgi:uncharacterized protein